MEWSGLRPHCACHRAASAGHLMAASAGLEDFLLTGPATNLNWALRQRPHLASKVGRVFWMAGAVEVDGNVRVPWQHMVDGPLGTGLPKRELDYITLDSSKGPRMTNF